MKLESSAVYSTPTIMVNMIHLLLYLLKMEKGRTILRVLRLVVLPFGVGCCHFKCLPAVLVGL